MSVPVADVVTTRPDAAEFWLFLHILGGMVAVGALALCVVSLIGGWRSGSPALTRLGWRALIYGAVPGYILLRVAAQVVLDKEGLTDADLAWIDIGFMVTDAGVLLLIIAAVLLGLGVRRGEGAATIRARVATGLLSVLLVAYLVAIWAMTAKPT